jgi:predicted nucleic acid-binding protein
VTTSFFDNLPAGDLLVLDTSSVIAYLNAGEAVSIAARHVLDTLVATERNPAVISSITVAEVMVRPFRELGRVPSHTKTFLLDFPGLSVRSADFLVAAEAARIRALTGAALSDALVAATATLTSSRWLITNDRTLRDRMAGFDWPTEVVLLSDLQLM